MNVSPYEIKLKYYVIRLKLSWYETGIDRLDRGMSGWLIVHIEEITVKRISSYDSLQQWLDISI